MDRQLKVLNHSGQSQRDCVLQPRVASLRATLGNRANRLSTPTGLRPRSPPRHATQLRLSSTLLSREYEFFPMILPSMILPPPRFCTPKAFGAAFLRVSAFPPPLP